MRIISWLVDPLVRDQALGDIEEHFHRLVCQGKPLGARLWCAWQIFPVAKSFLLNSASWGGAMFRHYLQTALRNFRRQKGYSFLNIFGLALGLACSILIIFYVHHELSFDRFHADADRIFRVTVEGMAGGNPVNMAITPNPLPRSLLSKFPEVRSAARIRRSGAMAVKYADREFIESGIAYADPGLFQVFTFPLVRGDATTALARPYTVVLTERAAKKYFGTEDPLGKFLRLDQRTDFSVTGVIKDVPHQSHLQFDLLCSLETDYAEDPGSRDDWLGRYSGFTYIRLDQPQAREPLEAKLPGLIDETMGNALKAMKVSLRLRLQPLTDIHLRSKLRFEFGPNGDALDISIFAAIAVIILAIASVNFMNLATARAARRAREVGLRKVVGAGRRDLIGQFLAESVSASLLALIEALVLVKLTLPFFKAMSGIELTLGPERLAWLVPLSFGLAVFVGLAAGSYPAFYLSAFRPAQTLKGGPGGSEAGPGRGAFRRYLVVGQFVLSILMISGTLTIGAQIRYMKNKDVGFEKNQVLAIRTTDETIFQSLDRVKSRLKAVPGVLEVSATTFVPGEGQSVNPVVPEGFPENATVGYREVLADADYVRTLGMEIVRGRDFSKERLSDGREAILLNETAVREIGWDEPIGKTMKIAARNALSFSTKTVIGVVRDFHYSSLHDRIEPLYISYDVESPRVLAVKVKADGTGRVVRELKKAWEAVSPGALFNYFFVDELFEARYRSEERLNKIFSAFSLLAIAIACLGLFGLASYMAERRKKEVGIRKVLGASNGEIVGLLSRDFLKLVGVAALVAWPVAYFVMNTWLREFAYRTDIKPWPFIFSGLAALAIAFLTVSFQAFRAASANPADTLKHE